MTTREHGLKAEVGAFNIQCRCDLSFSPAAFVTHLVDEANAMGMHDVVYPLAGDDFDQWRKNVEHRMMEITTLSAIAHTPMPTRRPPPPPSPPKTQQSRKEGVLRPIPVRSDPDHRPSCGTCQFTGEVGGFLLCQRNPPQVVMVHNLRRESESDFPTVAKAMWPRVDANHACGEFIVRWHPE